MLLHNLMTVHVTSMIIFAITSTLGVHKFLMPTRGYLDLFVGISCVAWKQTWA